MKKYDTVGDELRARADYLRSNREVWQRGNPEPDHECLMYRGQQQTGYGRSTRPKSILSAEAVLAFEKWLQGYLNSVDEYRRLTGTTYGHEDTWVAATMFNDIYAQEVDDVIIALDKCAADLG